MKSSMNLTRKLQILVPLFQSQALNCIQMMEEQNIEEIQGYLELFV